MTHDHQFIDDFCSTCGQSRQSVLLDNCLREIDRLRFVIQSEAEKHMSACEATEDKNYWAAFARKAHQ